MSEAVRPLSPPHRLGANLRRQLRGLGIIFSYPSGAAGIITVLLFIALAMLAPLIAPHGAFDVVYNQDHSVLRLSPPGAQAWFGTTNQGMDVLSQMLWGARVARLVGLLSALGSVQLGTLIGLVSG
jgi:peptide/nickel transport system permease protein